MPVLRRYREALYAALLGVASLCIHLLPFILYSPDPLGYDTGFYRRYLIQPFTSFPNAGVPGLGNNAWGPRILLDTLHGLHLSPDLALYGSYLFLQALLPILIFFWLRRHCGTGAAMTAAAFVIASSVQYQAFWYMFYKNIFALDLMIIAFIALERKRSVIAYVIDVLIALSHATSAIVYLLTLGTLFLIERGRRKEMSLHIGLTAAAFALANVSLAHEASVVLPTALFVEWKEFLWLGLPFFLLIGLNIRALRSAPIPVSLVAFTGVSILYPILHLPFYQRIFVYADVGLAALAGYGAYVLVQELMSDDSARGWKLRAALLCIAVGLMLGNLYHQIDTLRPLMSEASLKRIEAVGLTVPPDALILTSADEAPWYEGWTTPHVAAPGLLHDTHDLHAWNAFWDATSTEARIAFINSFARPLYVSTVGGSQLLFGDMNMPCLTEITRDLYRSDCTDHGQSAALATEAHPVNAIAAGAYNLATGQKWEWNADIGWPSASLTKLMTALVAREAGSSTQKISITADAEAPLIEDQAQPTFMVGDTLTQRDLVKSMLIESSNDAAEAIARSYGYDQFIGRMNKKAKALQMTHTTFVSPSGLSPRNISTVHDLALLAGYVWIHEPEIFATTRLATSTVVIANGENRLEIALVNIDPLVATSTFLGGKTGTLPEADQNLVAIFQTKKGPVLIIVLGADDRFEEAETILHAF